MSTSTHIADRTSAIAALPEGQAPRRECGFTIVRIALGVLLLTAAGLKLYGLNVTALPRVGWFSTPRVQIAAVAWESVLGLWLLSGAFRPASWLAAVTTFLAFAGVSGYFGWTGVASCGCFGVIPASPWAAFGVDVAALAVLAACRPGFPAASPRLPSGFARIAVGAASIMIALTGVGSLIYGSPEIALARLRGDLLSISADYIDFGTSKAGELRSAAVEVSNWTRRPVRLIGGTSDCSCVTTTDLPLTIGPGETRQVAVQFKTPPTGQGAFMRTAEIWTDQPEQRTIQLRVGCRVLE